MTFKVTLLQLLRSIKLVRIVSVGVRISIGKCEDLNCSLCGSGSSTDVTISDRRDRSRADLVCGSVRYRAALAVRLRYFVLFACIFIFMSLSILMWFFTVFEDAPLYSFMFYCKYVLSSVFLVQSLR